MQIYTIYRYNRDEDTIYSSYLRYLLWFNGNKIITTSGGGMLVSDNEERIAKVRFWSTQARDKARHYQHSELGYNYRMSNIAAGVGRGQLKVLDQRVAKKRYIYEFYKKELSAVEGISFMPENDWNEPNYWLTCIMLNGKFSRRGEPVTPDTIMDALEKENIESRPIWKPMHLQPYYKDCDFIGSNTSQEIFRNGLCLPSDTKMEDSEIEKIANIIKK